MVNGPSTDGQQTFSGAGNKKAGTVACPERVEGRHRAYHRNHPNHQIITFLADGGWLMADG
jgi:hypothetical protein